MDNFKNTLSVLCWNKRPDMTGGDVTEQLYPFVMACHDFEGWRSCCVLHTGARGLPGGYATPINHAGERGEEAPAINPGGSARGLLDEEGLDKQSATTFSVPGTCWMSDVNSAT